MNKNVAIIGAGLAGSEAAWQLAIRGIDVTLFEMRPEKMTDAHHTGLPAELVCSNSFKSIDLSNAHGLLKAELKAAGSLIVDVAEEMAVPAGAALAVDRDRFSSAVKSRLERNDHITYTVSEIKDILSLLSEYSIVVVAAGPLCSDALADSLRTLLGNESLYFYDAIAPVVFQESIDMDIAFRASRYDKGDSDYINCPMTEAEYSQFVTALIEAKKVPFKAYEQSKHFEGCLPIEVMAERGLNTLAFGPFKPVGLVDPRTGVQSGAVLQLRQENREGTLYNMVGCQTRMTWDEQKRVFRMIPGLQRCEFARMGSMHRNSYIQAPTSIQSSLKLNSNDRIYIAGQLTGVEGYTESTAMGMWVAMNVAMEMDILAERPIPDTKTMIGGLVNYLIAASPDKFQPMNANFGLMASLTGKKIRNKKERRQKLAEIALESWNKELQRIDWLSDRAL